MKRPVEVQVQYATRAESDSSGSIQVSVDVL